MTNARFDLPSRLARVRSFVPSRSSAFQMAFRLFWEAVTLPVTIGALLFDPAIHPGHRLTARDKVRLGLRLYRNSFRVITATSFKAHLAMAAKILQIAPDREGVVVECGSFLGGSAANLSVVCDLVGRQLIVYDSFEGMPPAKSGDAFGVEGATGFLRGDLEVVKRNVERAGVIERCEFRKGWFDETLPGHTEPIVAAFLDVDYQASMYDCIIHLWPHLVEDGYVFIDEYVWTDYCAIFWSERFWAENFGRKPPGLIGAGSGVPLGHYFLGPFPQVPPMQSASSVAYTRKDFSGHWSYYPEEEVPAGSRLAS